MRILLFIAVAAMAACSSKKDECHVTSVGACQAVGGSCGATLACGSKSYELKCTSPTSTDQKEVDCQCIDGGVIGKSVKLAYPLNATAQAVQSACGWK